ncbi:MAG: hypothetical protein EP338_10010 [Bacteroidetes bacterium]|nr:MAG: hypothetical protein EP338_10010 [Bacteroidota bacterium]
MKSIIYIIIILMSCGVKTSIEQPLSNNERISGDWKVTSNRMVRTPQKDDFPEDGYGSFNAFFGASYWSQSNGKTFSLQENGTVMTDLVDSKMFEQINMRYDIINDSLIEFSSKFPEDTILNIMPVKYKLDNNNMTWLIDELLEIKLEKE